MKLAMILLMLPLSLSGPADEHHPDTLRAMFWNLENLYDYRTKHDVPWTKARFYQKCNGIAKIVLKSADSLGALPDLIGFAEVENAFVVRQLLNSTPLRKLDYRIVHYESPDRRGIDCALLYREGKMKFGASSSHSLRDREGGVIATRDILLCEFDGIDVLVNHHPSKLGSTGGDRRKVAMEKMLFLTDSLRNRGHKSVFCMGDFNDDVWKNGSKGTIKYNGVWEKIDGGFCFGDISMAEIVFDEPALTEQDKRHGGLKPKRCFQGPSYHGGISDHYPILFIIFVD